MLAVFSFPLLDLHGFMHAYMHLCMGKMSELPLHFDGGSLPLRGSLIGRTMGPSVWLTGGKGR